MITTALLNPRRFCGDPYVGTGGARPRPYNPPVAAASLAFGEVLRRRECPENALRACLIGLRAGFVLAKTDFSDSKGGVLPLPRQIEI